MYFFFGIAIPKKKYIHIILYFCHGNAYADSSSNLEDCLHCSDICSCHDHILHVEDQKWECEHASHVVHTLNNVS